ncbi:hypothetical protein GLYMA_07G062800v4 [Glycine max]|nr:RING-H2 finger protein ATL67 [Glycine max]XP_028240433.1 RING-H2 finger protein ATL67-like [Glycine soja]KAG4400461.1 hypothetical protein GLYMA_07G062800v4 [Glycine max]RZC01679.1 RING-H2 finger protein ATL67 [Glycine soja]|eukprot:XP_025984950.1 RING-H2 finger protein ATL67-like [Glycine max]
MQQLITPTNFLWPSQENITTLTLISLPFPSTNGEFPISSFLFFSSMSSFNPFSPPPPTATTTPYLTNLGFGYSIAIALGVLFLLSTLILSSYLCCRTLRRRNNNNNRRHTPDGVVLPRVIFVPEDEDDDDDDTRQNDVATGLDQAVINSYPKFPFVKEGNYDSTCSICLCEYKDSEMLRMMPECRHYFHLCCLDPWLKLNGSCPVCRNSPMPTPLSTPLQEVVPLSQYADARARR